MESQLVLPRCSDGTAIGMLLTTHEGGTSTEISRHGTWQGRMETQFKMMQVLIDSVRQSERQSAMRCHRDMFLLTGHAVHQLLTVHGRRRSIKKFVRMLNDSHTAMIPVPPIVEGLPAADKLFAWRLAQYRQILLLDADVMVLRPLDDVFTSTPPRGLTMAHHPYDVVQGKACGIPLAERGVGALVVLRPSDTQYEALVSLFRSRFSSHKLRAEQTTLACYYHGTRRLHTLGCAFLHDMSTERHTRRQEHVACVQRSGVGELGCLAIAAHVREQCLWPQVAPRVHAVHFKGKHKPWSLTPAACLVSARRGQIAPMGSLATNGTSPSWSIDELVWDKQQEACLAGKHGQGVGWAGGVRPVDRKCCTYSSLVQARWYELRLARSTTTIPSPVPRIVAR
jgi:hypothetical protein